MDYEFQDRYIGWRKAISLFEQRGTHKEGRVTVNRHPYYINFEILIGTSSLRPRLDSDEYYFIEAILHHYKNKNPNFPNDDIPLKYIISFYSEAPLMRDFYNDFYNLKVNNGIKYLGISSNDLIVGDFLKDLAEKNNHEPLPFFSNWEVWTHYAPEYPDNSGDGPSAESIIKTKRKYFSTSLFRRICPERAYLTYALSKTNIINRENIMNVFAPYREQETDEVIESESTEFNQERAQFYLENYFNVRDGESMYRYLNNMNVGKDTLDEGIVRVIPNTRTTPRNGDSYFWISNESSLREDSLFVTEKTFKPMFWKQLPMVLMNSKTFDFINDIGFKYEMTGINYEYIHETHLKRKIHKFCTEIDRLSNLSDDEIQQLMKENKKKIDHNFKLAYQMHGKKLDAIITRDFHESIEKWKPDTNQVDKYKKYMDYCLYF
tara:strand:- start:1216 stop:2517 length:1302 start_codon:yes stop_codon:yes gene_type:complete